jgi:pimeloyl-ACP methyl ester carboxylesterase
MDALAEDGWDVWAVDLHGYGNSASAIDQDWSEAAATVKDLDTATDYIRAFRWVDRVAVFGYQWGAQVAGLFANQKPKKVARLALFGMRYQLADKIAEPTTPMRSNTSNQAMLKPDDGDLDPEMVHKRAEVCTLADPRSPNGALKDLSHASSVDPRKLTMPLLILAAERDGDSQAMSDRLEFFKASPARGKWFVSLAGLGKHAPIERGRARFERALIDFLDAP